MLLRFCSDFAFYQVILTLHVNTFSVRSRASGQGQEGDKWRVVGRDGKGRVSPPLFEVEFPSLCEVECSNMFGLLATQEEEEITVEIGAGDGDRTEDSEEEVRWEGEEGQVKVRRVSGIVSSG